MDFLPIAVLIVFVLLGGIIAVVADELGRRIGKRRLTLHRKIRPKTSARILAFASGVTITLITMILIGFASSDMRTLLLHGRAAIDDLTHQKQELELQTKGLKTQVGELDGQVTNLTRRLGSAQDRLKSANDRLKAFQAKLETAKSKADEQQARYATLEARANGLKTQKDLLTKQVSQKLAELSKRKTEVAALQNKYDYLYKDYTELLKRDQDEQIQNQNLKSQLEETTEKIDRANHAIDDLNTQKDGLEASIRQRQAELQQTQQDLAAAQQSLEQAKQEMSYMRGALIGSVGQTRFRPLIYSVNEEVLRIPIPAGTSKNVARGLIDDALATARQRAKDRGAEQANHIDFAGLPTQDADGNPINVDAEKDVIASQIAGSSADQVLIVYSIANAFKGEGVLVSMVAQPNPIVYQPNQVLAEVRVDGRQELNQILDTLDLLGKRIRTRALHDKMIPIQRGDASFGSVSSEDILALYKEICAAPGSVRVQAVTKRQIRAADPLDIGFNVK